MKHSLWPHTELLLSFTQRTQTVKSDLNIYRTITEHLRVLCGAGRTSLPAGCSPGCSLAERRLQQNLQPGEVGRERPAGTRAPQLPPPWRYGRRDMKRTMWTSARWGLKCFQNDLKEGESGGEEERLQVEAQPASAEKNTRSFCPLGSSSRRRSWTMQFRDQKQKKQEETCWHPQPVNRSVKVMKIRTYRKHDGCESPTQFIKHKEQAAVYRNSTRMKWLQVLRKYQLILASGVPGTQRRITGSGREQNRKTLLEYKHETHFFDL